MLLCWKNKTAIAKVKTLLDQDNIVLASGDTVLGLLGRCTQKSYDRLNEIKQRSGKPYLILVGSIRSLDQFIEPNISDKVQKLIENCWPGPVTIIFKAKKDLPDYVKNFDGTVAIRVPDHEGLLELLQSYGGLFSTSANIHTQPIPRSVDEIDNQVKEKVGAIILDDQTIFTQKPSTILDCSSGLITVIRQGQDLPEKVQKMLL